MSGWDEGAIYYSDQAQFPRGGGNGGSGDPEQAASRHTVLRKLKEFIRNFAHQNQPNVFPYRESLVQNPRYLLVNLSDLLNYDKDQDLRDLLRKNPADYLPLVQCTCKLLFVLLYVSLYAQYDMINIKFRLIFSNLCYIIICAAMFFDYMLNRMWRTYNFQ